MRVAVERLSEIFDSLDYHVALYDAEWRYSYVNREAARLLGREPAELIGRSIWDLFPDAVGNQYFCELHEVKGTGRPIHTTHFYAPFERWFENHIYPVTDGVLVLSRDVTAQRMALEAQEQRDTMLRLAQRAGGVGTFEWDFERHTTRCSAEFFSLLGLPAVEGTLTYDEWQGLVHPDDVEALTAHIASAVAGREPAVYDYRIVTPAGQTRWVTYAGQFVPTASGESRMLGTLVDITARKEAEARVREAEIHLRDQAEQLAEANRLKDEFLATLSHELRTPLNVICGRTSMLMKAPDLPTARQNAEIIERNAVTLEKLVADLLDVSRITLGQMRLDPQAVPLAPLVHSAVQALQPAADARGIELVVDVPADLPPLWADSTRLQQVVWNLLNNAHKFTPDGGRIVVGARLDGDRIRLEVRDSGQGIEPSMLPHVFDMFWQGESTTTRTHGGLGLGLSIAQRLVELHGGEIKAQSDGVNKGAVFIVRLPVAASVSTRDELVQRTR